MYEIDFDKVAREFNKDRSKIIPPSRLKAIYSGKYPNATVQIEVKKLTIDRNGNTKKKFLSVDYSELAKVIYEEHGKAYEATYLKAVHNESYQSAKVLGWINEILGK